MYYVYIIFSDKLKKLYKGSTSDLRKRINRHNKGDVKSTHIGILWKLIYYEYFLNKMDAIREEKFLKTGRGRRRKRVNYLLKRTLEKSK